MKCEALSLFATDCNKTINTTKGGKAMLSDYDDYLTPYEVADELALSLTTVYTKHHLKFRKIKPTILNMCDFGADFSFILLVFSIIAQSKTDPFS